jgi:hypothetical protein
MRIHAYYPHKWVRPNMHALRRIEYSTNDLGGINNYKPLKLVLKTMLACPYAYSYS